jgi:subtilase family protein
MSSGLNLVLPWARRSDIYSCAGSLILKLTLGEAPPRIPQMADVWVGAQAAATRIDGGPVDRVLKHFSDGIQVSHVHSAAASLGKIGRRALGFDAIEESIGLSRTFQVDIDDDVRICDVVDALRQLGNVEHVYPHYFCTAPMATATVPQPSADLDRAWAIRDLIRCSEAQAYEPGDPVVVIGLVDTGVMLDNTEYRSRLRRGVDAVELLPTDLPPGSRLLGTGDHFSHEPIDSVGHGTACAGILCASGQNVPPGLAGDCSLLPNRVLGSVQLPGKADPVGVGAISDIDCGIKITIDLGAKIINLSLGTPKRSLDSGDPLPHNDVIQYGLTRGCIFIAAAGNSGKEEEFSPAALKGVIAVSSTDALGHASSFSTRGAHVTISAPGEKVLSTGLHGYSTVTGTSFAAPFVTAAVALLVSRAEGRAFALDADLARQILCDSARAWPPGEGKGMGAGVLDACAALQKLDEVIDRAQTEGEPKL